MYINLFLALLPMQYEHEISQKKAVNAALLAGVQV